jgi:SAM-dependent methyltransferase
MTIIEKATIFAFHRHRMGNAPSYELGWRNDHSQLKRLEVLCRIGDLSGCMVLDLGCGYGDLKTYLDQRFQGAAYIGVDFLPEFIAEAKKRHGHAQDVMLVQSDFLVEELPEVDVAVASGSLNYRSENELHPWQTISRMWAASRKGVAFNLLDAGYVGDTGRSTSEGVLCSYDPEEVLTFCRKMDPYAEIISGYLPDDFTVLMRRPEGQR